MSRRLAVFIPLLACMAGVSGFAQNSDPKASDQTGNGPPAVVIEHGTAKGDSKKASTERPVSGFVTGADGKPVAGAVVQLKNMRSLQVRSFITHDKGEYYFAGLSKDVDYELQAQFSGHTSSSRTLSSFDTKTQPVINLQIK